jgi:TonB-linked SusC/RagA family outer membrane protein
MKRQFTLLFSLLFCVIINAQTINIEGVVKDAGNGDILPGVSITIKGTKQGVQTDFDGYYSLKNIDIGVVLIYRYLGYKLKEVLAVKELMNVVLEVEAESLNEIIVIGYGTQRKKESTGAVAVVDAKSIEKLNPTRIEQALQGQVSGVAITSNSGSPGSGLNIRIRGVSTNGDNSPLILVDGNRISDLSVINPNDIKSVNVLKDATAAIYGVLAANGVILIETKSGKKNTDLKFSVNSNFSLQQTSKKIDLLNGAGLGTYINEATNSSNYFVQQGTGLVYDSRRSATVALPDTDWQSEVFQLAPMYDANINASGGADNLAYSVGASFLTQDGIIGADKSNYNRLTARANIQYDVTDKLKLSLTTLYTHSQKNSLAEGGIGAVLYNAINADPFTLPRDATPLADAGFESLRNGYGIVQTGAIEVSNPLSQIESTYDTSVIDKISPAIAATYKISNKLSVRSKYLMNRAVVNTQIFRPLVFLGGNKSLSRTTNNEFVDNKDTYNDFTWNNIITYEDIFKEVHNLKIMLGHEMFETKGLFAGQIGIGLLDGANALADASISNSELVNPRFQPIAIETGNNQFQNRLMSYFGRVQYAYKEKYLVSALLRRDQSSRFSKVDNFNVGYFNSVSLGWNISEENFLKDNDYVSSVKLRASFGQLGSDRVSGGDFPFVGSLNGEGVYSNNEETVESDLLVGIAEGQLGNPFLKWETTTTSNIGLDVALLGNKISFNLDVFQKITDDLLIQPESSGLTGVGGIGASGPAVNAGTVENSGIEFLISYRDQFSENFKFNTSLNFTAINNNVTYVGNLAGFEQGGGFGVGTGIITSRMEAGHSLGYFHGYKTNGIYQSQSEIDDLNIGATANENIYHTGAGVGDLRFVDTNGDGHISEVDKTDIGDPIADITAGLNAGFSYKKIDFSASAIGSFGNNMVRDYQRFNLLANKSERLLNRWTPTNPSNSIPRASVGASINTDLFSDYFVEDASFVRIQNIQVGYTFDKVALDRISVDSLRLFLSVNNLHTFTKYSGFDPSASSGQAIGGGIDRGFYPVAKTVILGFSLTF